MIIVIQCAARKNPSAGYFRRRDGQQVLFVADPRGAPPNTPYAYAHPDDIADTGKTWRDELLEYNRAPTENQLGLLPAWQLYANDTYGLLKEHYAGKCLYILSAGWGLIGADFLTPNYDITFSGQADDYKRRRERDRYNDLRMLPTDTEDSIVLLVSKGYVNLASNLTQAAKGPRHLFYNSSIAPDAPGCNLIRYETTTRTNWHYECARALMNGSIWL